MTTPTAPAPSVAGPAEGPVLTEVRMRIGVSRASRDKVGTPYWYGYVDALESLKDWAKENEPRTPTNPTPPAEAAGMFEHPRPATCPQCSGALRDAGPNQGNDLRFVECAACNVCWTVTTALAATPPVEAEARGLLEETRAERDGYAEALDTERAHVDAANAELESVRDGVERALVTRVGELRQCKACHETWKAGEVADHSDCFVADAIRALAAAPQGVGDGGGLLGEDNVCLSCERPLREVPGRPELDLCECVAAGAVPDWAVLKEGPK